MSSKGKKAKSWTFNASVNEGKVCFNDPMA